MAAEEDLPPENPASTLFTSPDCGCTMYVTRCPRYTDTGVYVYVTINDILSRCEHHEDLRQTFHRNDINREKTYFEDIVRYHETH